MWDRASHFMSAYNHVPGGGNILHIDGHVQFYRYPGKAPISQNAGALLGIFFGSA